MINNLQVLRAFAAINVVFFHTLGLAESLGYKTRLFGFLTGWGANGVDIFFVISGFIMVYIQSKHPKTPIEFLKNRIIRIVPLYWSITLFVTILFYLYSSKFNLEQSITSLLFISHSFGFIYPVITPGWSLEFEMLFYLIFGFCIYVKPNKVTLLAVLIIMVMVFLDIINSIMIEFVFGMIIAGLYLNNKLERYSKHLFIYGLLGLLASVFFKNDLNRIFLYGLPATFLVLGSCYIPQIKNRILIFVGNASYSIYLVQALSLPVFSEIINWLKIPIYMTDLLIILNVILTTIIGSFVYYFYEKPLNEYLKLIK